MAQQSDHEPWDSAVLQPGNLLPAPEQAGTFIPDEHLATEEEIVRSPFTCSKEPTKSDWDRLRPEIEMLYTKHELRDIMVIMKDKYNLRASEKMYKDRRREWGISKNVKSWEMEAIVRKTAQRLQAGKKSYFQLRNTWVADAKIKRYRKDKKIQSEQQAMVLRAPTPLELLCYTPLASPVTTPRHLEIPERLIKVLHEYIHGSFDSNSWRVDDSGWCRSKKGLVKNESGTEYVVSYGFVDGLYHAAQLLSDGMLKPAWQALQTAMSLIVKVVPAEVPSFVFDLIGPVLMLFRYNLPDIAIAVLHQSHHMSIRVLGEMHPLSQSSGLVKDLVASNNLEALLILYKVGIDDFTCRVGELGRNAVDLQLHQIHWSRVFQHDFDSTGKLQALLKPFRDIGLVSAAFMSIQLELTQELRHAGRFQEAFEICESIAKLASEEENARDLTWFVIDAHSQMSRCHEALGDLASAEHTMRQAINMEGAILGFDAASVLLLIAEHAMLLERYGALDEAMQVREYHERVVASKYERISQAEEEEWQRFQALEGGESVSTLSD
ncbi:MAG: hypothetical protein OHK93_005915 [Ramalina farinacea]|uniref:Clr5 domain-containing protein n=1 Tax=Ramalina farinacea TaxID=258253 RepID=A0AA43TZL4_9LECA|nr:hypothetical protein [Ramalina farinacea]